MSSRTPLRGARSPRPTDVGRPAILRRWVPVVTLAELAGFLLPVSAVLLLGGEPDRPVALVALLAAGAGEGALLGWGQSAVLSRVLPGLSRRDWIVRTAFAAVVAWAIGLAPVATEQLWEAWPLTGQVALAVPAGAVLLASIGLAQWTVLRGHVHRSARWVGATALAWLAGLGVFMGIASPLWQPGQPPLVIALIGVLAGAGMALTMATITGLALVRLLATGQDHR